MSLTHRELGADHLRIPNEMFLLLSVPVAIAVLLQLGNGWEQHAVLHPLYGPPHPGPVNGADRLGLVYQTADRYESIGSFCF